MSGVLERTLGVLECLASHPEGLSVSQIAERINIPASAAHRLVSELVQRGYVRQTRDLGDYTLTTKLVAMVLDYMGAAGIVDFAQPVLDRLAKSTGDFVRLSVIDKDRLVWVARAQGARAGLRYDPDVEAVARLSCTASGHAWLMTMSDEAALELVYRQGFGRPEEYGPAAPSSAREFLDILAAARRRGYGMTIDMFGVGLSSVALPIRRPDEAPVGVISVAGPSVRLTEARIRDLIPEIQQAAHEVAQASSTSPLFASRRAEIGAESASRSESAPLRRRASF